MSSYKSQYSVWIALMVMLGICIVDVDGRTCNSFYIQSMSRIPYQSHLIGQRYEKSVAEYDSKPVFERSSSSDAMYFSIVDNSWKVGVVVGGTSVGMYVNGSFVHPSLIPKKARWNLNVGNGFRSFSGIYVECEKSGLKHWQYGLVSLAAVAIVVVAVALFVAKANLLPANAPYRVGQAATEMSKTTSGTQKVTSATQPHTELSRLGSSAEAANRPYTPPSRF